MEYFKYIKQKKELYDHILIFFNEENDIDLHFQNLINIIQLQENQENSEEFKAILYIVCEISKNHYRSCSFQTKIEQILSHYEDYIKQHFTKEDLFKIFIKSPQILRFLFDKGIITVDEDFIKLILSIKRKKRFFVLRQYGNEKVPDYELEESKYLEKKSILRKYKYYFFKYIRSMLKKEERLKIENKLLAMDEKIFDNFDEKCQKGENDSYISKLIREDSVIEFIAYVNKVNISLDSKINPSIFETNPFLMQNVPSLIEYAAFFGSIQIFNYLRMNQVELNPSIWFYAVHGNNPSIIHILEECEITPPGQNFIGIFKESIKCHHNEIAHYIENNLNDNTLENNFKDNAVSYGFHYHNYEFLQDSNNLQFPFFYACLYDYLSIVELLIKTKQVDYNQTIIPKFNYL